MISAQWTRSCRSVASYAPFVARDRLNQSRAGTEARIVQLLLGSRSFILFSVLGRQKRALMMVEPPGQRGLAEYLKSTIAFSSPSKSSSSNIWEALCAMPVYRNSAPG